MIAYMTGRGSAHSSLFIPLKLIEMGCLPGNSIKLLQLAPFNDPMYLDVNGSRVAIRRETANYIIIKKFRFPFHIFYFFLCFR